MDNQETIPTKTINPYYKQSFNITLLNSLLDDKYCVYKLLQKNTKEYSHTYLSLNIQNKEEYIVKFYKLNQIEDFHEMQKLRYKVLKRAEIFFNLKSSYVIKCYEVYQNQCYLAIIYQYFQRPSLQTQLMNKRIARCDYAIVLKHMLMAVLAVHRTGLFAKKLDLSKIYFKNGYYKLAQFNIFWSEHSEKDLQICPELRHFKQQHIDEQIGPRCDLWALALFQLKLLLGPQYRQQVLTSNDSMTVFTKQLQNQVEFDLIGIQDIKQFLKRGLMINPQDRTGWPSLFKLLNLETQNKKGNIINLNQQLSISQPSYIGESQDSDRTPSPTKRRTTTLTRTFLVNTAENIIFQQQEISTCKAYFDEQQQLKINSNSFLVKNEKQNPFYLSLFINTLRYVPLLEEDVEIFLQKLKYKQKSLYQEIETCYFQAQKSQYILKNFIRPIEADNLLNLENKRNIEFMYLVCSRIFTNLSYVNLYLKNKKSLNEQDEKIIKEYQKNISSTYQQAKNKFTHYSGMLTSSQNKLSSMFLDRCKKIANQQEKEESDCYLTGIEGADYLKKDQIIYTHNQYMSKIMRQLEKSEKEQKKIKILLDICDKYIQIMSLVDSCQIRGKQFEQCVKELLRKDNNKNNMYGEKKFLSLTHNKNDNPDQFIGRGENIAKMFKKKSSI